MKIISSSEDGFTSLNEAQIDDVSGGLLDGLKVLSDLLTDKVSTAVVRTGHIANHTIGTLEGLVK